MSESENGDDLAGYLTGYLAGLDPREELRHTVADAVWHAVDRMLGRQEINPCRNRCCADVPHSFDADRFAAERQDAGLNVAAHVLAVQLAGEVGLNPAGWVANARSVGATWEQIGVALGVSRQAAQQRFPAA